MLVLPTTDILMIALVATHERIMKQKEAWKPMFETIIKFAKEFPKLYPNCKLEMVDTGHIVMYQNPEVVSGAMRETLKILR